MNFASFGNVFFRLQNYNVTFVILSCENHTLRFDTHHFPTLEIKNEDTFFAEEAFRFVPLQQSRNCLSLFCSKIHYHSYEVS